MDVRDRSRAAAPPAGSAEGWSPSGPSWSPGFDLVADKLSLAERMAAADLVVTGEGYLDKQSFAGKAVGGVARLAAAAGVPVLDRGRRRRDRTPPSPSCRWSSASAVNGPVRAPAACITEVVAKQARPE